MRVSVVWRLVGLSYRFFRGPCDVVHTYRTCMMCFTSI